MACRKSKYMFILRYIKEAVKRGFLFVSRLSAIVRQLPFKVAPQRCFYPQLTLQRYDFIRYRA